MKVLTRLILIAGLVTVLMPCACDEIAQVLAASSCNTNSHDCCGGQKSPQVHKSMDQKAFLSEAVQVHPPVIVVQVPALPLTRIDIVSAPLEGHEITGLSPPAYNRPLLI
jgi:hypothetical protein